MRRIALVLAIAGLAACKSRSADATADAGVTLTSATVPAAPPTVIVNTPAPAAPPPAAPPTVNVYVQRAPGEAASGGTNATPGASAPQTNTAPNVTYVMPPSVAAPTSSPGEPTVAPPYMPATPAPMTGLSQTPAAAPTGTFGADFGGSGGAPATPSTSNLGQTGGGNGGFTGAGAGPGYTGAGAGPGYTGAGAGPGYTGAGAGPGFTGAGAGGMSGGATGATGATGGASR